MAYEINDDVLTRLRDASSVAVITGTGVAAECGVPTFSQCHTGKWAEYAPTDLATAQAFLRTPRLVWDWYAYRREQIERTEPGASHYALVDLEQYYYDFTLITQSIDGLHWRAGSRTLIELHGNIGRVRCFECGAYTLSWDDEIERPPLCVRCGGLLRPDVIWLGEGLSSHELRRAYHAAERSQVLLSVGTSAEIRPAASLPLIAKRAGAFVIEINPVETALAVMADLWIACKASDVLPQIAELLNGNGHHNAHEEGV
jgi:NAD-dependent deacetylase